MMRECLIHLVFIKLMRKDGPSLEWTEIFGSLFVIKLDKKTEISLELKRVLEMYLSLRL